MRGYLREHGWGIAAFFLFTAVFGVTFALYGLPLEAVAYPAGLCALLGGALVLSGILRRRRQHKELLRLRETGAAPDSDVYEIHFSASMSAAHTLTWQTMVAGSGDADGNGKVDTRDALLALRAVLDAKAASTLPEADVSGDDKLTLADVLLLLKQISAGK